jgi:hypothetical protein
MPRFQQPAALGHLLLTQICDEKPHRRFFRPTSWKVHGRRVRTNPMHRALAATCALAATTLVGSLSLASPTFPAAIQEHLDLACKPDCTNCHTRPQGGLGTARQPFGLAMQRAGLTAGQPSKIAGALDRLEQESSDVDGDGTNDIEELIGQTSPNAAGESLKCLDEGSGGGCSMTRVTSTDAGALACLVAGLYLARPRLRRASERLP